MFENVSQSGNNCFKSDYEEKQCGQWGGGGASEDKFKNNGVLIRKKQCHQAPESNAASTVPPWSILQKNFISDCNTG